MKGFYMSFISDMQPGSIVTLETTFDKKIATVETTMKSAYEKEHKQFGHGIICEEVLTKDGKLICFKNLSLIAKIKNKADNREYDFLVSAYANVNRSHELVLFSIQNNPPVNFRDSFRVPCSYRADMQIGPNRKVIEGFVHDISFSGISFTYDKDEISSTVGQSISATLRNNDGVREKSYKVAADIVRVQDWNNDKILIGAKFKNDDKNVKSIVAECQRKELRVRKLNSI